MNYASVYPPYVHVALQEDSPTEQVILGINENNVNEYMKALGIIGLDDYPARLKVLAVQDIVKNYDRIFARKANIQLPPPPIAGMTRDQAEQLLREYTPEELIEAYEVNNVENGPDYYERLINKIYGEGRGGSKWRWVRKWCNNDDTFNIDWGDLHGDMAKKDPNDPTLSYGVLRNYRCYQV